jgi:hypothetical protein
MNFKRFSLSILTVTVFATATHQADAQSVGDYRSKVSGGAWSDASTWEVFLGVIWIPALTPPDASKFVTIRSGYPVHVDTSSGAADHILVGDNLTIDAGATLTLDGSGVPIHNIASGKSIILAGSGATLSFVNFYQTVIGEGTSSIKGQHSNAKILFEDGLITYFRDLNIEGAMQLNESSGTGTTTLVHEAYWHPQVKVSATIAGTLELGSRLIFEESIFPWTDLPLYQAMNNTHAVLLFKRDLGLAGDFVISDCAVMRFDADVGGGSLTYSGTINARLGSFSAGGQLFEQCIHVSPECQTPSP